MRRALLLLLGPVVATAASCLGATEIQIHVTTNACASLSHVDIYVGGQDAALTAPGTSAPGCKGPNEIGTLTVVPSGGVSDPLQLAVVGALSGACTLPVAPGAPCIVARRALSYVPHTRLELPIYLDSACAGVVCDEGQTCVADPTPRCVGSTCGADGGVLCSGDAGTTDVTVPPTCSPSAPDAGAPTLVWSFDDRHDDNVHEDTDNVPPQPLLDGFFATDIPTCGQYFNTVSQPQPLAVDDPRLARPSFEIAFAYDMSADGLLVSYDATQTQNGGYQIGIVNGALDITICSTTCGSYGVDNILTADGTWHRFAMKVETPDGGGEASLTLYRDGQAFVSLTNVPYFPTLGTLSIASGVTIDQLEFYAR